MEPKALLKCCVLTFEMVAMTIRSTKMIRRSRSSITTAWAEVRCSIRPTSRGFIRQISRFGRSMAWPMTGPSTMQCSNRISHSMTALSGCPVCRATPPCLRTSCPCRQSRWARWARPSLAVSIGSAGIGGHPTARSSPATTRGARLVSIWAPVTRAAPRAQRAAPT